LLQVSNKADTHIEFMRSKPHFGEAVWGAAGGRGMACTWATHRDRDSCREVRQGCAGRRGVAVVRDLREQSSGYVLVDDLTSRASQMIELWWEGDIAASRRPKIEVHATTRVRNESTRGLQNTVFVALVVNMNVCR